MNTPVRILGLPDHLATPPDGPTAPDDPLRPDKIRQWEEWALGIMRYRVERREMLEKIPALLPIELRYCAEPTTGPIYWGLMYGWIYEPRENRRQAPDSPFIFYRFQIDLILWWMGILDIDDAEGAEGDGVVSKARDMGATWVFCLMAAWGFLFASPWQVRLISWRGDEVDSNHPDSMFWKIAYILTRIPAWQLPEGFSWEKHRHEGELINPVNANSLVGQTSTPRAMSGARATWLLYDEAAKNKYYRESYGSTTNVAEHRASSSSEHLDYNTLFYQQTHRVDLEPSEQPQLFEMDYWMHPYHDERWRARQQARNASEPGAYEREVLRDPRAGSPTVVYPIALGLHTEHLDRLSSAPLYVGIDPGSSDKCAICWVQDNAGDGKLDILQATMRAKQVADFHGTIIRGTPFFIPPIDRWEYTQTEQDLIDWEDWDTLETFEGWTRCEESFGWDYTPDERELMRWVRQAGRPVMFYGDRSGKSTIGVTKDTVYSRLLKFGIIVNRDRTPAGESTADKLQARTYQGRQQATKAALARTRFNDSRGGRMMLRAFQEYRWDRDDKPRQNEPMKPLHDDSSHLVTSYEYINVQRAIVHALTMRPDERPAKAVRGRKVDQSTLYARTGRTLTGTFTG